MSENRKCINVSSPEFKKLSKETNLTPFEVEAAIYQYQKKFNTDEFPDSNYVRILTGNSKNQDLDRFYVDPDIKRTFALPKGKVALMKIRKEETRLNKKYPHLSISYQKSQGPDPYYQLVAFNKQDENTPVSKLSFFTIADKLRTKFNIDYQYVTKEQASEILKGHNYNGESAFYYKGKVYFTEFNLEDPIHEYAHPFIRAIKESNPELWNSLLDQAFTEHYSTVDYVMKNYPEYLDEEGYLDEFGAEEVLVRVLTDYAKESVNPETGEVSLGKRIWDAIISLLKDVFGVKVANVKDLNPNVKLKDLSNFFIGFDGKIELKSFEENNLEPVMFNRSTNNISPEHNSAIEYQSNRVKATPAQISIASGLVNKNIKKINPTTYEYEGENYDAVTNYMKTMEGPKEEPEFYKFHEQDENKYAEFREWGNQYDELAEAIVMGYSLEEAINFVNEKQLERAKSDPDVLKYNINEDVLEQTYDSVKEVLDNNFKDDLLIPQVIFFSKSKKIAGTSDIVAVTPEGKLKIVDVKSSKISFFNAAYKRNERFDSASKYQRYQAQLSMYKGLALDQGYTLDEDTDLMLLNIHSTSSDGFNVELGETEGIFPMSSFNYITDKFKTTNPKNKVTQTEKNIIRKIRITLQKQLELIKDNPNVKSAEYKKWEIGKIIESIGLIEQSRAVQEFLSETYSVFVERQGENKTYPGIKYNIRKLANNIKKGSINTQDALNELHYYKELVNVYKPIVEDISGLLSEADNDNQELNEYLGEIVKSFNEIEKSYNDNVIPLIADILSEQIDDQGNTQVKEFLAEKRKVLEQIKQKAGENSDAYKIKLKDYERYKVKLKSEGGLTKEVIIKALREGSLEDISTLDTYILNATSSNNEIVSLFAKHLKNSFENDRQQSIDLQNIAGKAFKDFVGNNNKFNPSKVNEKLFEKVEVFDGFNENGEPKFKDEYYFISPIDYNRYNKALAQYRENLKNSSGGTQAIKAAWQKKAFVIRPKEDITITNPYNPKEKIVVEKGLDTLIKEKELLFKNEIISLKQLEKFKESIKGRVVDGEVYYDNYELLMINPKEFNNSKYDSLNSSEKKYYDFLMATYLKAQQRTGTYVKNKYRLPSVYKSNNERLGEQGVIDYIKENVKDSFSSTEKDVEELGEITSDGRKVVPMLYSYDMSLDNVSTDLLKSVMMYDAASLMYKSRTEALPLSQTLLDITFKNSPLLRDSLNNTFVSGIAKKVGYNDEQLKSESNNVYKFLAGFIDRNIYGISNIPVEKSILGKKIRVDQASDSIKSFASKTQIGGLNFLGAFANSLQANVQVLIEAHGGQFFNKKDFAFGKAEYTKLQNEFLKDFNNGYSKSLIGQLVDLYDALQGEFIDKYGNKVTATTARKLLNTDTWFFLHHKGEHAIQVQTMIAMLNSIKVKDGSGKEISLYEAYELGSDGIIKLKEGVVLPGKVTVNNKVSTSVQNKLHALNKRMHGIYNKFDQPELKKQFWGRLMFMYKDFIVPGFKRRYKTIGIDSELDSITEGYYNTFFRKAKEDYKILAREFIGLENPGLQPWERANIRKSMIEMGLALSTGLLLMLLNSLYSSVDDEDKKYYRHLIYSVMRLNSEIGAYGVLGDPQNLGLPNYNEVYRTFKQPFVLLGTIEKLFGIIDQITSDPLEEYQRDSGVFKKGDYKLIAKLYKFFGLTGTNINPENSIKYMNMTTR